MSNHNHLLGGYKLGSLNLPNRVVIAPMTRNWAGEGDAPTELNATRSFGLSLAGDQVLLAHPS